LVASIPIIAFVVLTVASVFLVIKRGFSGIVETFIAVSVIFCIGVGIFLSWAFAPDDTMILTVIFFIPAVGLASVLLITLIILFIFALISSSKDKEMEVEMKEKARQIEREIGEGR
jgi:hypothetical protein